MTTAASDRLYFRQLLSGRDFAIGDTLASEMVNYAYVIGDQVTHEAVLVDPAYDPTGLIELVADDGYSVVGAIVSHYHGDHAGGPLGELGPIAGIVELLEAASVPIYAQRAEIPWLERTTGMVASEFTPTDPGTVVEVGSIGITCIATPGHTPGSQCLLVDGTLLSGDTLFLYGCGRTDLPGGDADALVRSLVSVLAPLDPAVTVFPGHAYDPRPSATIGEIVATNPVFGVLDRHRSAPENQEEG